MNRDQLLAELVGERFGPRHKPPTPIEPGQMDDDLVKARRRRDLLAALDEPAVWAHFPGAHTAHGAADA